MKPREWMELVLIRWGEDPAACLCRHPPENSAGGVGESTRCSLEALPDDCGEFTCYPSAGTAHFSYRQEPFPHIVREARGDGGEARIVEPVAEHGGIGKCSLCGVATTPRRCVSCRPAHQVCASCWSAHRKALAKLLE